MSSSGLEATEEDMEDFADGDDYDGQADENED